MDECLSDEVIALLIEGQLAPERARAVHEHLADCPLCRSLVANLTRAAAPADGAEEEAPRWPPERVEHYQLLRPLGEGAMGQVYLARDTVLDRQVALKFLRASGPEPELRERLRFLREAQAVARLAHGNVVAVHGYGELHGHPYLVSEYVRGKSLDQLPLPLPSQEVRRLGLGLARGLAAAHRAGVLHRDIKPQNAMVTEDGEVKLLDFGLAKLRPEVLRSRSAQPPAPDPHGATAAGTVLGTPRYLAPEAWAGSEHMTAASDLYSLGVVLFELCTGRPPHLEASLPGLFYAVSQTDAPPLRQLRPEVDPALSAVVDRCLRRAPAERYQSAEELCAALAGSPSEAEGGPYALRAPAPAGSRRRRALLLCGAAGVILTGGALLVGGGPFLHKQEREAPPAPATAAGPAPDAARDAEAATSPGEVPPLIEVPGGTFLMGSTELESHAAQEACLRQAVLPKHECQEGYFDRERPQRRVQVASFQLTQTEVTVAQYARWLNGLQGGTKPDGGGGDLRVEPDRENGQPRWVRQEEELLVDLYPSYAPPFALTHEGGRFQVRSDLARRPMTHVTWTGALRFCQDHGLRLPTEAEWELSARGPEGRRFPWGSAEPRCDGVAFHRVPGGACAHLSKDASDVGTSPQDRTPLGLFDLGGNVMEWVLDRFTGPYRPCAGVCADEAGPSLAGAAAARVIRGGDLNDPAVVSRAAGRSRDQQGRAAENLGFRCARPLDDPAAPAR